MEKADLPSTHVITVAVVRVSGSTPGVSFGSVQPATTPTTLKAATQHTSARIIAPLL
jgi:hypothetical protein